MVHELDAALQKFTECEVSKASVYLERSWHQDSIHDHQYVHLLLKIDGEAVLDSFLLRKDRSY